MQDIADRLHLSQSTVSCVLNGRYDRVQVSEETRQRVLTTAGELGYRHHGSARALRTGRMGCLALLASVAEHRSPLFAPLLDGLVEATMRGGRQLLLSRLTDAELCREEFVPTVVREWRSDGVIIHYDTEIPVPLSAAIDRLQVHAIWLNAPLDANVVRPDDEGAGSQAVRALLALGHRRIGWIDLSHTGGDYEHYSARARRAGYEAAMRSAGKDPLLVVARNVPISERQAVLREVLRDPERPTAMVTYCDDDARALQIAALAQGVDVPRDLSVLAIGNGSVDYTGLKPISRLAIPWREIGIEAVARLDDRIRHPGTVLPPKLMAFVHEVGETCTAIP